MELEGQRLAAKSLVFYLETMWYWFLTWPGYFNSAQSQFPQKFFFSVAASYLNFWDLLSAGGIKGYCII